MTTFWTSDPGTYWRIWALTQDLDCEIMLDGTVPAGAIVVTEFPIYDLKELLELLPLEGDPICDENLIIGRVSSTKGGDDEV